MRAWFLVAVLCSLRPAATLADDDSSQWSLHGQATYISQEKPAFHAAYSGSNSLKPEHEASYSFTATIFAGARLWAGGEGFVNVEGVQGVPFSNMSGLGGFTNGELQKTAGPSLSWYRARLFMRQTIGYGGGTEEITDDKNQFASLVDKRRLVLFVGNLAAGDLFDTNRYAHDPRTDYVNWAVIDSGAYDYAADARGYTSGIAAEWHDSGWILRMGRFAEPKESNGLPLDFNIARHYGDQIELEVPTRLAGHDGKLRLLAFRNVAIMARYRDALDRALAQRGVPALAAVRRRTQKVGAALNLEQEIGPGLGAFFRASWNDGQTETYSYTEIDGAVAGGVVIEGRYWGRPADEFGFSLVQDDISHAHRDYLASGGLGFFLGDGRLSYRPERIVGSYYSVGVAKHVFFTVDAQRVRNPGYNANRGPANFFGVRLHAEF